MTANLSRLLLVLGLGVVVPQAATLDACATSSLCSAATESTYSCTIEVSGDIEKPGNFTLHDFEKLLVAETLRPTTQNVGFRAGSGFTNAQWTGVLLWDFLKHVGIEAEGRESVQKVIEVGASDGYFIKFGAGEIDPGFGGHQVVLAFLQNGAILGADTGFARLIFPGDKSGARNIFWIKSIKIN
jgi:DMSO/TMAO reductase YedYZ molybdopterin-dependent catalytic subunit